MPLDAETITVSLDTTVVVYATLRDPVFNRAIATFRMTTDSLLTLNITLSQVEGTFSLSYIGGDLPFAAGTVFGAYGLYFVIDRKTRSLSGQGGFVESISGRVFDGQFGPFSAAPGLVNIVGIMSGDRKIAVGLATIPGRDGNPDASAPIGPVMANTQTTSGLPPDVTPVGLPQPASALAQVVAQKSGVTLEWRADDYTVTNFSHTGTVFDGIRALAGPFLNDVWFRQGVLRVVNPLDSDGVFGVDLGDLLSRTETVDTSRQIDQAIVRGFPGLGNPGGGFKYDIKPDPFASKSAGGDTIIAGSTPQGFVEIPGGLVVDGFFEEWTPPPKSDTSPRDESNPNATVQRYWKVAVSPNDPNTLRGITSITRLLKPVTVQRSDVAAFFGSGRDTITSQTANSFIIENEAIAGGVLGYFAYPQTVQDIVTGKFFSGFAVSIRPPFGTSGDAANNWYSVTFGARAFPPVLDNTPNAITVFFPPTAVGPVRIGRTSVPQGINVNLFAPKYFNLLQPRRITEIAVVMRQFIFPRIGQNIVLSGQGIQPTSLGRVLGVSVGVTAAGATLNIQAEQLVLNPQ